MLLIKVNAKISFKFLSFKNNMVFEPEFLLIDRMVISLYLHIHFFDSS